MALTPRMGTTLAPPLIVGALIGPGPAHAIGDETQDTPTCKRGEVYDSKAKRCVKRTSAKPPDRDLAAYAYALAKAERYQEAIEVLDTLTDPHTAEALNYRGYATRELGRTEEGIGYYLEAVRLDPRYALVREYPGEAYVLQGRTDLAHEQLAAIERICGDRTCEPYEDLAEALGL